MTTLTPEDRRAIGAVLDRALSDTEERARQRRTERLDAEKRSLRRLKRSARRYQQRGYGTHRIADMLGITEDDVRELLMKPLDW